MEIEYEPTVLDAPDEGFVPLKKVGAPNLLESQIKTADWLKELGAEDDEAVLGEAQQSAAREAFSSVTTGAPDPKTALLNLKVPEAVRRTVTMLTAYDWEFVQQAKEIRGKAVAQLVDEMEHPDARIRLKAIELIGKVNGIDMFTERVTVKKEELPDDELDKRIKEKLAQLQKTVEAEVKERDDRNSDAEDVKVIEEEPKDATSE